MNKTIVFLIALCMIGSVFAVGGDSANSQAGVGAQPSETGAQEPNGEEVQAQINEEVQTQNSQQLQAQNQDENQNGYRAVVSNKGESVQIKTENGFALKDSKSEAKSDLEIKTVESETGTKINVELSNGRNAEVKIMPSTASATAISRLGLVNCIAEEGCSIELKEVGKGNSTEIAYEVESETEGKFLGLFKTRARVKTQVSAETGEILRVKKPFLTSVKEAKEEDSSANTDEAPNTQIANPASEFCVKLGGEVEIRTADDGSQSGVCLIETAECDEWALFRNDCEAIHVCTDAEKAADACTQEYVGVCGSDGKTYGNTCTACSADVKYVIAEPCQVRTSE